ncbi:MAG: HipA domain-containing protein [Bacteroidetes bacterium]|nr:HipA domain-containing protein [Bacteroidota bacterium]
MKNKCLYCYESLEETIDFHEKCALMFFGASKAPKIPYSLKQMADLAKKTIERSIAIPGVQPKLSLSIVKSARENSENRLTVVGALGGHYIFKPPSGQYPEVPQNEHVTMRIAEAFGIQVVPSSLIRLKSGELSYITKRIDRTIKGEKIHLLDMFQITEAYNKYKGSMEMIAKAIQLYSVNTLLDKILYFELAIFSFLTGNNDMHLKNFSMINSTSGWVFAPAYDLLNVAIANPQDTEELALTLEGKKKKLKREHFERLGKSMGLNAKQILSAFNRMAKNKPKAIAWIEKSFLSDKMKAAYIDVLETRYKQLSF